ncbi:MULTISPECIES: transposase [unclassified Neochlamydia]|uniref:IS66 family transposase n=1 Tax=unclassified Neochlamydia TaxID=2643326 RepID=UPI001BC9B06A|nr:MULTISPECIES: transposase [unclassified Neochlamydia]
MRKFCQKLLKQIKYFQAYLKDPAIPMINNAAEESLRNLAIVRKLCLDNQSTYSKRWKGALHSCIGTLYRQGKSILDFLADAIYAACIKQPIPIAQKSYPPQKRLYIFLKKFILIFQISEFLRV